MILADIIIGITLWPRSMRLSRLALMQSKTQPFTHESPTNQGDYVALQAVRSNCRVGADQGGMCVS